VSYSEIFADPADNRVRILGEIAEEIKQARLHEYRALELLAELRDEPDTSLLAHLYSDEQGEKKVYGRLREDESMKKGLAYLDKALLLAPKSLDLYRTALHLRLGFEETDELQKLQPRLRAARIELKT